MSRYRSPLPSEPTAAIRGRTSQSGGGQTSSISRFRRGGRPFAGRRLFLGGSRRAGTLKVVQTSICAWLIREPCGRESAAFCWGAARRRDSLGLLACLAVLGSTTFTADPAERATAEASEAVSYYRDVRPILQANCQGC